MCCPSGEHVPPDNGLTIDADAARLFVLREQLLAFPRAGDVVLTRAQRLGDPAEVFVRITKMGQFPVEQCGDPSILQQRVADLEVAVDRNGPR